ncbi:MAG: hypothetical protein NPIRA03_06960 [Nitrospirales bacterium]|nr:MAG: hypothetical protein NPIRA03_06960 [Nitrospirales bacterium]
MMAERDFSVDHSTINRWVHIIHHNWKPPSGESKSALEFGGEGIEITLSSKASGHIIIEQSKSKGRRLIFS